MQLCTVSLWFKNVHKTSSYPTNLYCSKGLFKVLYNKLEGCRKMSKNQRIMCHSRRAESMARVPTSLQVSSAMARNLLNSQSVCIPLFSCQPCLAALTRQTVHAWCNPSLYLLQNCFLPQCVLGEAPQRVSYTYIAASLPLLGKYQLRHVLIFCEWLKIYFLFTSIIFCMVQLI